MYYNVHISAGLCRYLSILNAKQGGGEEEKRQENKKERYVPVRNQLHEGANMHLQPLKGNEYNLWFSFKLWPNAL